MKSAVAFCLAATAAFAFIPATAYAQGQLLRIQELQGKAELQRGGRSQAAAEGGVLQADDTLVLGSGARAALKLGRHGLVELGPGSSVQIERLPFATYATDLRTVLRLQQGYLRVIWKQPPLDINWPLFVYVDTDSANLMTGEYFFEKSRSEKSGDRRALCSAEGDLTLTGTGHAEGTKIEADSCWIVTPAVAGLRKAVDMDDWVAVRQGRALARVAEVPKTAVAAASVPASPPPSPALAASPSPNVLAATQPTMPVYTPKPTVEPPKPAVNAPTPAAVPAPLPAYKPSPAPVSSTPALNPNPAPLPAYKPATLPPPVAEAPKPSPAAKPIPAPVPAPSPAPASSAGDGRWAVNIASVPDRPSAQKELAKLGKSGFAGAIAEAQVKGKTWYRVQIQGLPNREEADDTVKQLKSAGYAAPWVIKP